jgi:hypothetical protein
MAYATGMQWSVWQKKKKSRDVGEIDHLAHTILQLDELWRPIYILGRKARLAAHLPA